METLNTYGRNKIIRIKNQQCIIMPKKKLPKNLHYAFPTFLKIWRRAMLGKFWDKSGRVLFYITYQMNVE